MKTCVYFGFVCGLVVAGLPAVSYADGMDARFTYQGQLKTAGVPLSDQADFRFSVWNAAVGGERAGSEYQINGVTVDRGLFTVPVDPGANVFDGDPRWLEVSIRHPTLTGPFVLLTPRQPLTGAPYAFYSDATRGVAVADDGKVGVGTAAPKQPLHVGGDYYGRGHVWLYAYEGDGSSGTAYLQARDDSGSSSIDLRLRTQAGGSIVDNMVLKSSGNVGIGTSSPAQKLEVNGTIQISTASGPHLIIRDSNGSNDRPGIEFAGNNIHYIAGDDLSNEGFGFYSRFGNARAYDAVLSVYGNTQGTLGTWGRCLSLTHDGTDGKISTDTGHMLLDPAGCIGISTGSPVAPVHLGDVGSKSSWSSGNGWGDFCLGDGNVGLAIGVATSAGAGDVRLWTKGGMERLIVGSAANGAIMTIDDARIGMTSIDPIARLNVTSLSLSAPSADWAAHFKDANGTGEAWLAGDDGQGRQYGIEAHGSKAGGFFKDADGVGEARIAYSDGDNYQFGVWARGQTGAYFESTEVGGSRVSLGGPAAGVWGRGDFGGGSFSDTDDTAWADVASGSSKIYGNGSVHFVQNHPLDSERVIVYAAPEGDEVATYTRGTARLGDGEARVLLGETFQWVTNPDIGLTAYLTPREDCAGLYVASLTTTEMIVRELGDGTSSAVFDYIVFGLRIGFEETSVVQEKRRESPTPSMRFHREQYRQHPELRGYNSFERFKRMRAAAGDHTPMDLAAAVELRAAIGSGDSGNWLIDPPWNKDTDSGGVDAARADTESAADIAVLQAELSAIRARLTELDGLLRDYRADR